MTFTLTQVGGNHFKAMSAVRQQECPKCKGTKVVPQFGGFMAQTAKKS